MVQGRYAKWVDTLTGKMEGMLTLSFFDPFKSSGACAIVSCPITEASYWMELPPLPKKDKNGEIEKHNRFEILDIK